MTQLHSLNSIAKPKETAAAEPTRKGLFLVKPASTSHAVPADEPRIARRSRSLGLLALAAAAMAAPLIWFFHELLTTHR